MATVMYSTALQLEMLLLLVKEDELCVSAALVHGGAGQVLRLGWFIGKKLFLLNLFSTLKIILT